MSSTDYRKEQVAATVELYIATGKVCGRGARQGGGGVSPFPAVKAYRGRLPSEARGIEFVTDIAPYYSGGPVAYWYEDQPGVETVIAGELVCIPVVILHFNR